MQQSQRTTVPLDKWLGPQAGNTELTTEVMAGGRAAGFRWSLSQFVGECAKKGENGMKMQLGAGLGIKGQGAIEDEGVKGDSRPFITWAAKLSSAKLATKYNNEIIRSEKGVQLARGTQQGCQLKAGMCMDYTPASFNLRSNEDHLSPRASVRLDIGTWKFHPSYAQLFDSKPRYGVLRWLTHGVAEPERREWWVLSTGANLDFSEERSYGFKESAWADPIYMHLKSPIGAGLYIGGKRGLFVTYGFTDTDGMAA